MSKHFSNRHFQTTSEQRGTLLLAGLLCLALLIALLYLNRRESNTPPLLPTNVVVDSLFADSSSVRHNRYKQYQAKKYDSLQRHPKRTWKKRTAVKRDTIYLFRDSFPPKAPKYEAGTLVSLNAADTTELKMIPGIGSAIARLIIGYRQQLGGYSNIEQLNEINLNAEKLRNWFVIDTTQITPINLNRAGINRLRTHPYLNFYQARVIIEHRRKHGNLRSLKQLSLYEEFSAEDLKRLSPYICFE